ncbi:MAG: DUF2085 domain-containing protein [Anaerolineae bacterium]|nr:DUF2085 domain-containing protein [Anaerolineae bacterium]
MTANKPARSAGLRLNLFLLRVTNNWLRIALVIIGLYASLPIAAPTLMALGATGPARALYTLYSPFCHQFAFRSIFLFGEQAFYPRYNTGSELRPFETYAETLPDFAPDRVLPPPFGIVGDIYSFTPGYQGAAREFVGNPQMGYKTALCARDMGIYLAVFAGALIYSHPVVRRRLRPVPIWLYVLLGLGPIAVDGLSQMLGYPPFNLWPPRETLPIFRVTTGVLFGLMNAWLGLPYLELSMRDTRDQIMAKLARAGVPLPR